MGLTGAIFTYAIKRKLRADNPVRGIETPKDRRKLRRLSEAEYRQLWTALSKGDLASDLFLLLAVSGWRSGEARCLKWSEVDLDRKVATLSDTKSGLSVRPLSSAAIQIIQRQEKKGEFVFEHRQGQPIRKLFLHWAKLGMPDDERKRLSMRTRLPGLPRRSGRGARRCDDRPRPAQAASTDASTRAAAGIPAPWRDHPEGGALRARRLPTLGNDVDPPVDIILLYDYWRSAFG